MAIQAPDGRQFVRWSGDDEIDVDVRNILAVFHGRSPLALFSALPWLLSLIGRATGATEGEMAQTLNAIRDESLRLTREATLIPGSRGH
jgi:hypothetical protein